MAMFNDGIGGQVVKQDANEALADLDQNKTLFIQKLTDEEPMFPQAVYDLKTVDDVFEHFKPSVTVDFQNSEGVETSETINFRKMGDFNPKAFTEKSPFLQDLAIQKEQYMKMLNQFRNNKPMIKVIENQDTRASLINTLHALIQELEDEK